jgi:hypothetical protein
LQEDFLKGKPNTVYKARIDEVMEDLLERDVAAKGEMYRY